MIRRGACGMRRTACRGQNVPQFLALVGLMVLLALGVLLAPLTAAAQQHGKIPLVGVLRPGGPSDPANPRDSVNVLLQGLRARDYVEGQTILLEYRFAEYQWDRLPRGPGAVPPQPSGNAPRGQRRGAAYRFAFLILTILFFLNSTHMHSMIDDISCHLHSLDAVRSII